jgi:hypothetical protein
MTPVQHIPDHYNHDALAHEANDVPAPWVTCGGGLEVSRACHYEVLCERRLAKECDHITTNQAAPARLRSRLTRASAEWGCVSHLGRLLRSITLLLSQRYPSYIVSPSSTPQ